MDSTSEKDTEEAWIRMSAALNSFECASIVKTEQQQYTFIVCLNPSTWRWIRLWSNMIRSEVYSNMDECVSFSI